MTRFRSKIVEIDAWQFVADASPEPDWLVEAFNCGQVWSEGGDKPYMIITTLEGIMRADVGDWIIRGLVGELYPCKPDIFERKYELAP